MSSAEMAAILSREIWIDIYYGSASWTNGWVNNRDPVDLRPELIMVSL